MGYAQTTHWGHPYEINAGFGTSNTLTTVVIANVSIGAGSFPTRADLDNGEIIGAYCDMCIPSFTNSFAGANWIKADANYPKLQVVPTGHSAIDAISTLTGCCYGGTNQDYPYNWVYGDTNFASIFASPTSHYFGHTVSFYLNNIRSEQNNLVLNNKIFRFRFYVR